MAIDAVTPSDGGDVRLVRFSSAALLERARGHGSGPELRTDCHVTGIRISKGQVVALATADQGLIPVPDGTRVVLSAGTIENARLIANANSDTDTDTDTDEQRPALPAAYPLSTHLRSNLTVRLPVPADLPGRPETWGAAALYLRGAVRDRSGADLSFHHQITASTVGHVSDRLARRLYLETPRFDAEALSRSSRIPPRHLVITIASVAQMAPGGTGRVALLAERDGAGARRAGVRLEPGPADLRTWAAMDRSADEAVRVLTEGEPCEYLQSGRFSPGAPHRAQRREPLGCGHHEMGTLPMGDDPARSATDGDGRVHGLRNLYIAGPAAFPALDSAGPVLPGTALTLRLADHLHDSVRRAREGSCAA
jgi:choline dehydrogenase-like flavoprotein